MVIMGEIFNLPYTKNTFSFEGILASNISVGWHHLVNQKVLSVCLQPPAASTGHTHSRMDAGGRQRLLGRLLGKLRGDHRAPAAYPTLDKRYSVTSSGSNSESIGTGSADDLEPTPRAADDDAALEDGSSRSPHAADAPLDDTQFAANIDLRYGGQYLSPDQLPEFCNQLHHLVQVIRNIHSYAKITGEYPAELERRLEQEAREVAALAAEARNARDVVARTRAQRRAVRAQRRLVAAQLATLKETETRELENSIRMSDRKLYKSWEALKSSTDPAAFEPLLDEIRGKQAALENLVRLIEGRCSSLTRPAAAPTPLPPPEPHDSDDTSNVSSRKRFEGSRRSYKRKRGSSKEPRSVPLSGEPSRHGPQSQDSESSSRYRVGSAGAVTVATPIELPSHGSVRDILFFSLN